MAVRGGDLEQGGALRNERPRRPWARLGRRAEGSYVQVPTPSGQAASCSRVGEHSDAGQEPMERASRTPDPEDRANELYWGSDRSVNQIAEELDLSKGAFYGMIRPLAAGLACPACGREVAHMNRTAKERALVACLACGWEGGEDEALPEHLPPAARPARAGSPPAGPGVRSPSPAAREAVLPRHLANGWSTGRTLAVGALIGGAVGLALVLWVRRR